MNAQPWVILLVKLAVAASLASILTRSAAFQRMLMREERTLVQRVEMALSGAMIFGTGVAIRIATAGNYRALDLGLEGALVFGMMGGYVTVLLSGVLISIPAMFNGEFLTMPVLAGAGVLGAIIGATVPSASCGPICSSRENAWRSGPCGPTSRR